MIEKTEAVVLQTRKFGDTSKIAVLFTKEYGKISVIAKGAATPKSKFGSSLDPMSYIHISFYQKNRPGLQLLANSELIQPLRRIISSPEHMAIGLMSVESVSKTIDEHYLNQDLFNLLKNTLVNLNNIDNNPQHIYIFFTLHLFKLLGFEINFNEYSSIDTQYLKFSLNNASIAHSNNNGNRIFKIDINNWIFLKDIYKSNFDNINSINSVNIKFSNIFDFFMNYIAFHLEKPFNLKSKFLMSL